MQYGSIYVIIYGFKNGIIYEIMIQDSRLYLTPKCVVDVGLSAAFIRNQSVLSSYSAYPSVMSESVANYVAHTKSIAACGRPTRSLRRSGLAILIRHEKGRNVEKNNKMTVYYSSRM